MKNLCLYLMVVLVLLSIIVTTNVIAMEKTKQDNMKDWFEDILAEINNLLFYGVLVHPIRELAVTIFNLFIPIMFLAIGAGLAWNWWFFFRASVSTKSPLPPTNSASQHDHNLRPKRQKHFI